MSKLDPRTLPENSTLYRPEMEHDNCGVGFVAHVDGKPSHKIIQQGIQILINLTHRGAVADDPETGDGAGILIQVCDDFFRTRCSQTGLELPAKGAYGVGVVFLPQESGLCDFCIESVEQAVDEAGQNFLGWSDMPVNPDCLGKSARESMPQIKYFFVGSAENNQNVLERKLLLIRKIAESKVRSREDSLYSGFHIPSLSSRTIVYKGLMLANQVPLFFEDLNDPKLTSVLALVHQRYSTNTFPSWELAQPFRVLAHNGEINTLRGNVNWTRAREATIESEHFGDELKKMLPIISPGGSDSMALDNIAEMLAACGRSLPHVMMMLVPEPWGEKYQMSEDQRGFFEYHSILMEPWDGPAAIAFTDGRVIGCCLDRNGLRPARYVLTTDNMFVLASEVGVLEFEPERIRSKGRVGPGEMLLIDIENKRIVFDPEVKAVLSRLQPYRRWVNENRIELRGLFDCAMPVRPVQETITQRQIAFGYTDEDMSTVLNAMASKGVEPVGSMGNDTPLAVLSDKSKLLFNYFKQLFAQVTNPAIDPIREQLVMSLMSYIGREANLIKETPRNARLLKLSRPILTNDDLDKLKHSQHQSFRTCTVPILFRIEDGIQGVRKAFERCFKEAEQAVGEGYSLIVLSDRGINADNAAIPSLLAVSAVHHHLLRCGLRTKIGIVIETGEAREVAHFAQLLGYGASAIIPYLAFESVADMAIGGALERESTIPDALDNYMKAVEKGLLKIFSKMGISTVRSYRGAQIFEAVGLDPEFIEQFFPGTGSRIGGVGLEVIIEEVLQRHRLAFSARGNVGKQMLPRAGEYNFRKRGEYHAWSPEAIFALQQATSKGDYELFRKFSSIANENSEVLQSLRGLLRFKDGDKVPIEEVEPVEEIMKRFVSGAMSYGSISKEAHQTLAIAMNRIGGMSNSGEGGEDEARFETLPNGDSMNSAIKQVASGRFGVTTNYLAHAKDMQIKVAQGSKPGEGGQLPGHKVSEEIARVRHSVPGVTLISPPPHHDIYSIEDLAQLIFDLKNVNSKARVSVKLVSEIGVGTVAAGVAKARSDVVVIAGDNGGTGASPLSSIKHAGVPWEIGLAETQQVLVMNNLRSRIRIQVDGQMKTGRDVAIAALLGAEEFGFATSTLIVMGCVMMRKCHLNTCPVGVATQDKELRKRFMGKADYVVNFFRFIAEEVREIMSELGFRRLEDMVGRVDLLEVDSALDHWKARGVDLGSMLTPPPVPDDGSLRCMARQADVTEGVLDHELIEQARPALERREKVEIELRVRNVNRSVGTLLSGEVAKRYAAEGLPSDTIGIKLNGSAGQSFGAFLAPGISLHLDGDANDYVGKGMSGGRIVIRPPAGSTFRPEKNIIVGNVVLYGATGGKVYFNGCAGERFAIRNSGASAVVEGVGDHGCEYMTGGVVVVLGPTGLNFAAGMSGGIAYVYDEQRLFDQRCNLDMVDLEAVTGKKDVALLKRMIEQHIEFTGSPLAQSILDNWHDKIYQFVKVMPMEYRRALGQMLKEDEETKRVEVWNG